jgi:hypothetical protein
MTGGDEAHYLSVSQECARLVAFPDGISRHITLKKWHWEVVDRLQKDKSWPQDELPSLAFQHALEFCDDLANFEWQLRRSFLMFVEENMAFVMVPDDWSVANQKF